MLPARNGSSGSRSEVAVATRDGRRDSRREMAAAGNISANSSAAGPASRYRSAVRTKDAGSRPERMRENAHKAAATRNSAVKYWK